MSKKFKLEFDGLDDWIKEMQRLGANIDKVAEKALIETFETVTPGVQNAMNASKFNFNRTGQTRGSLITTPMIERSGTLLSVPIGFDISNGGLPSIFLMHGTPRITPDRNLYNSIFGKATMKRVAEVQQNVFLQEMRGR